MRLSPLVPILCLSIIAVLVGRILARLVELVGYPLLFAGLISLSLTLISAPLSALIFQVLFAPALPVVFPAGLLELFKGLTAAIVRNVVEPALLVAGIMLLVGLVMVALGFLFRQGAQTNHRTTNNISRFRKVPLESLLSVASPPPRTAA